MNETNKQTVKWYHKPVWIFVAILAAGPFAMPLVWFSPALKKWHKIAITIALVILTIWLVKATMDIFQTIIKQMADLQNSLH